MSRAEHLSSLKQLIFDELVDLGPGGLAPREKYERFISPYQDWPYPMCNVGFFNRVTRKNMGNWINLPRLTALVRENPRIDALFFSFDLSRHQQIELVTDVNCEIGTLSYSHEWDTTDASEQIDDIINLSTKVACPANRIMAQNLKPALKKGFDILYGIRDVGILDAGSGRGNTILPILDALQELKQDGRIPEDYLEHLTIYPVDVSRSALAYTSRKLENRIARFHPERRVPEGCIVPIHSNFARLSEHPLIQQLYDSLFLAVSGAAPCHITDPSGFYSLIYDLLMDGGLFRMWDWHNGYSFAAPWLRISRDGRRRTVYYDGDGFLDELVEDEIAPPSKIDSLHSKLEQSGHARSVFEMTDEDKPVILSNYNIWLNFLYFIHPKEGFKATRFGQGVDDFLREDFERSIRSEEGFSFVHGFLPQLMHIDPYRRGAYRILEGTGADTQSYLADAGFSNAHDRGLLNVYRENHEDRAKIAGKRLTEVLSATQVVCSFAEKRIDYQDSDMLFL